MQLLKITQPVFSEQVIRIKVMATNRVFERKLHVNWETRAISDLYFCITVVHLLHWMKYASLFMLHFIHYPPLLFSGLDHRFPFYITRLVEVASEILESNSAILVFKGFAMRKSENH